MASNKKLELHCSIGTFRRVESDPDFRVQIACQHAGDEAYEEIIFTQGVAGMASATCDESRTVPMDFVLIQNSGGSSQEKKLLWLDAPTKLLLALVKELRPEVGKSANLRNKKQMWNTISNELCAKSHFYNAAQVEGKFFILERRYKNVQLHNSQTGKERQTCPYQAELDEIFKERASVHPEYVIDNAIEVSAEADEVSESSPASPVLDVAPYTSRKRKSAIELFMEKRELRDAKREKIYANLQKLLKENIRIKEESMRRKEARAERREQLQTEKNSILKSLVDLLKI